jgi:hypothetical protein
MKKIFCHILSFLLFIQAPSLFAQNVNKAKKKDRDFNIRELALPSEVQNVGKKSGSIYYSPSVKGKVLIPVHFWGEIKFTGLHFVPLDTSLINGISLAGGPAQDAILDKIHVTTRRSGEPEKFEFDISKGGDKEIDDFALRPGDTIFIEKSTFRQDRAYYTGLIGVIATILSSVLLYREVKK